MIYKCLYKFYGHTPVTRLWFSGHNFGHTSFCDSGHNFGHNFGHIPATFPSRGKNFLATFWSHEINFPATFRAHEINFPATFQSHEINFLVTLRLYLSPDVSRGMLGAPQIAKTKSFLDQMQHALQGVFSRCISVFVFA